MGGASTLQVRFIYFGEFKVDLAGWVLFKNGSPVPLQKKPFQILRMLITRPGELVTRAELAAELWPDLHVDYNRCLNTAVNALRTALDDRKRDSRWIETRSGVGYRFIGEVSTLLRTNPVTHFYQSANA